MNCHTRVGNKMTHKPFFVFCLSVSLLFASCTTHRSVEANNLNIQTHIQPGDKVRVITKDDKESEFVVTEVTDEAIVGENENLMFSNIAQLEEVSTPNGAKIILYTLGFTVLVALALVSGAGGSSYSGTWW